MKVPVLLCLLAICVQARIGDKCRRPEESECEPGECCQTPGIPHYVHTRELLASLHPFYIEGTCQRYRLQGEQCAILEQSNGYCGCGPGLHCQNYEVKLSDANNQPVRRYLTMPRPGYTWEFKCAPGTN